MPESSLIFQNNFKTDFVKLFPELRRDALFSMLLWKKISLRAKLFNFFLN